MQSTLHSINILKKKLATIAGVQAIHIEMPKEVIFGDLSSNIAMQQAKAKQQSPRELAELYAEQLREDDEISSFFSAIEVVGPGFINFFFADTVLVAQLVDARTSDTYGALELGRGKTILIEYSSPNTNKPLHVGHLRNQAIGMSLAKTLRLLGYTVVTTEIVNDRGVHIMKSLLAYQRWGGGETPESTGMKGDHFVGMYYVKFGAELKKNPALADEAQAMLKRWEEGDEQVRAAWRMMNDWVLDGMRVSYERFGSEIDVRYFESDIYMHGKELVEEAVANDNAYINDSGATVVDVSEYGLGSREDGEKTLLRKDGTTVYMTQDLYLAFKRYQDYNFEKMIYVVGDEQSYHFAVLFAILKKCNIMPTASLEHYAYGHVVLPEGRMKSREGTVVHGDDLLDELQSISKREIQKRDQRLVDADITSRAELISLAAVKYWFLKANPRSRIIFDPQTSLDFEGNTGPYLLYTVVRLSRILRDAKTFDGDPVAFSDEERLLVRKVAMWPLIILQFDHHMSQNAICEYVYELASLANSYYQTTPILKADPEVRAMRLQVVQAVVATIKVGLEILNIEAVDQM